ncbi:hypothetical protein KV205_27630 [Streptomyces sp. SKN60]|uniref:hypothetical protein n=1 Tax=Streptomyces sp. SKN60 TaxID=2855506 RepID=UPI0022477BED|nr:hypothetical protein [Streptomyces sp. SKN60]MCX2184271.1 hypothetical protein [Streptomyces sp. SKN60]
MNITRFRSAAAVALAAVALTAALTGCQKDKAAAPAPAASPASTTAPAPATTTDAPTDAPTAVPASKPSSKPSSTSGTKKKTSKTGTKKGTTSGGGGTGAPGCVTSAPNPDAYDPDEFALYRIEELPGSTGKVNLVLQHGAWGCGTPDSDGAPFVVSGEDSRWALDQAAYVTATDPIVPSTENQRIGVQELIDWVNAHPDSGLVFRYEVGEDGAIHRLDQVFMP